MLEGWNAPQKLRLSGKHWHEFDKESNVGATLTCKDAFRGSRSPGKLPIPDGLLILGVTVGAGRERRGGGHLGEKLFLNDRFGSWREAGVVVRKEHPLHRPLHVPVVTTTIALHPRH